MTVGLGRVGFEASIRATKGCYEGNIASLTKI